MYKLALILAAASLNVVAQEPMLENIEWTDVWVMNAPAQDKPRVLLVGDSIARGYYSEVEKTLAEEANCARFTTSAFVSNPDFLSDLTTLLKRYPPAVVHVNNGLHGREYTSQQYREGLQQLLSVLREHAPGATIVWCASTPVRLKTDRTQVDADANNRVLERNRIAAEVMEEAKIAINDLYALMNEHPEEFSKDGIHYEEAGRSRQAKRVVEVVREALEDREASKGAGSATGSGK